MAITCGPGGSTTQQVFDAVNAAELKGLESTADAMTAESEANEALDTFVKKYTSNGDGTFTETVTSTYSAFHHATKAAEDESQSATAAANANTSKIAAKSSEDSALATETRVNALVPLTGTSYSTDAIDNKLNAILPYSGYTQVAKKLDSFIFDESVYFTYKVASKDRYVKFGDVVYDTQKSQRKEARGSNTNGTGYETDDTSIFTLGDFVEIYHNGELLLGDVVNNIGTDSYITFYSKTYNRIAGEEYIAKIIQTNTFNVPDVRVETTNTTTASILKGDYVVVDKPELVTNGTFDTDTAGWIANSGSNAVVSGEFEVTGTSGVSYSHQTVPTISGKKYTLALDKTDGTANAHLIIKTGATFIVTDSSSSATKEHKSYTFIAEGTTEIRCQTGAIGTAYYDNISVKQVSDTYRASENTADMYDYENNGATQTVTVNDGDVIYITDATPASGTTGNYYKRVGGTYTNDISATLTFSDPTKFTNLGTATAMSLQNPYFTDRTDIGVTNQVLSAYYMDTTTKAVIVGTEVLQVDCYAVETTKAMMLKNGFSEVSPHLYSKGTNLVVPMGYFQTLNKGAYEPSLNRWGCNLANSVVSTSSLAWYLQPNMNTLALCFDYENGDGLGVTDWLAGGSIAGLARSGHPQGKFYDIVYKDQFRDMREYSKILTIPELEVIDADKRLHGVEDSVAMVGTVVDNSDFSSIVFSGGNIIITITNNDVNTFTYRTDAIASDVVVHNAYAINNGKPKRIRYIRGGATTYLYGYVSDGDWSLEFDITKDLYITDMGTKPVTSSGDKLSTDLLADPINYKQAWKDKLASGLALYFNPLLVGEDGEDYTDGRLLNLIKISNKIIGFNGAVKYSTNSGATWSTTSNTLFSIANIINSGLSTTSAIFVIETTSKNLPYQIQDPKPVIKVIDKVVSSNSHSIYKGGDITALIGKIPVGNGARGFESKSLENAEIVNYSADMSINTTIEYGSERPLVRVLTNSDYKIYKYIGATSSAVFDFTSFDFNASVSWVEAYDLTFIGTTPEHSAITVDTSISPTAKWFKTYAEDEDGTVYAQVNVIEMKHDGVDFGDTDTFSQLTNGTITDLNGTVVKTVVASTPLNGKVK